jgi:hypothetical protein
VITSKPANEPSPRAVVLLYHAILVPATIKAELPGGGDMAGIDPGVITRLPIAAG